MELFTLDKPKDKIILSEDQEIALREIKNFLKSKKDVLTLSGFAGSGKTHLTKYLIADLYTNDHSYILIAPTHKAKLVLSKFAGEEAFTLHQLLLLSPRIEIENFDIRFLEFIQNNNKEAKCEIPYGGLVIVDEASMINDDLYDILVAKCKEEKCKILFVGDKSQLRPVKNGKTSKVFDNDNVIYLTKIHRQKENNPLSKLIFKARNEIIPRNELITSIDELGSLYAFDEAKEFLRTSLPSFDEMVKSRDILHCKLLTYTNARVQKFNAAIRKNILNTDKEYVKGDIITCYDTSESGIYEYINSEDYFVNNVSFERQSLPETRCSFSVINLELKNSENKSHGWIPMLSKNNPSEDFSYLAERIEQLRLIALNEKKGTREYGKKWQNYFRLYNSFFSPVDLFYDNRLIKKKGFDYGYALTVHKSQGSSFDKVFIDIDSFKKCRDLEEVRQLQYVGLSRTRSDIYVLK